MAGESVEQAEAVEGWGGQDHEIGALDRLRGRARSRGDHAGRQRGTRTVTIGRPGRELPRTAVTERLVTPGLGGQGAGDRPADEPQPEECDTHLGIMAGTADPAREPPGPETRRKDLQSAMRARR